MRRASSDKSRRVLLAAMILVSVGSLWANGLFAFTDRAWVIMGAPPEMHPEWLYLLAGLPLAITSLVGFGCSLLSRFLGHAQRGLELVLLALGTTALVASIGLIWVPFIDKGTRASEPLPQILGDAILFAPGPIMLVELVLGLWLVSEAAMARRRQSPVNVR